MRFYINEENNRRRNHLQKYISLCADAKVQIFNGNSMMLLSDTSFMHQKHWYDQNFFHVTGDSGYNAPGEQFHCQSYSRAHSRSQH
jgi:hypothetical protein